MPETQQIHIKLLAELHKRLRVRCAMEGITMQDYVTGLVDEGTKGVKLPEAR